MNEKEFKVLFHAKYNSLCNYANQIVKNEAAAEDIVQEVFIDFWRRHGNTNPEFKIDNYIVRAVKYSCIDYFRKQTVHANFINKSNQAPEFVTQPELNPENSVDLAATVNLAIDELPEKTKEVFTLSKIKKLSYREIATKLGISEKTVENQMARAFKHLRVKLKDYRFYIILIIFYS